MKTMPPAVSDSGDILLHAKEGLRLPVTFQVDDGTPRDMTGGTVKFYVKGGPTIVLVPGSTTDELVIVIPAGAYNALLNKRTEFALIDETASPANLLWSGTLTVMGFA